MRGWIIVDSLMTVSGMVSIVSGRQSLESAVSLTALGLLLLTLTLGAKMGSADGRTDVTAGPKTGDRIFYW